MTLHLVRHGRPLVDPATAAATWELDPSGYDDVWSLRERLPSRAAWYSSPEPKAVQTAELITDGHIGLVEDFREQERPPGWVDDFPAAVRRAFAFPEESARPGWETVAACRARVTAAAMRVLAGHVGEDVILVGHGTAWTLLVAELNGAVPDLLRWESLALPDVLVVRDDVLPEDSGS